MEEIKSINISRSFGRKIKFGGSYEMADIFSSYTAICEEKTDEKTLNEISEKLFKKAKAEVDLQVEILQNPGKVVRGYASINELNTKLKQALKEIDELKKNIKEDVPFVS